MINERELRCIKEVSFSLVVAEYGDPSPRDLPVFQKMCNSELFRWLIITLEAFKILLFFNLNAFLL